MRPCGDATRRDVRLLRQHHRARAVGVVALHLGDVVGAVHELEVRGVGAVLRHLLRHGADHVRRRVEVAPRGIADLLDHRDLPLRRFLVRVVPREHEAVAHDRRVGAQLRLAVRALAVRDVRARRPRRRTASRGTGTAAASSRDRAAVREVRAEVRAERVLEVEVAGDVAPQHELAVPVLERGHLAGREVARGTRPGTSRTGVGKGKRLDAMRRILEHVSIIGQQRPQPPRPPGGRSRPDRGVCRRSSNTSTPTGATAPISRERARAARAGRARRRPGATGRAAPRSAGRLRPRPARRRAAARARDRRAPRAARRDRRRRGSSATRPRALPRSAGRRAARSPTRSRRRGSATTGGTRCARAGRARRRGRTGRRTRPPRRRRSTCRRTRRSR